MGPSNFSTVTGKMPSYPGSTMYHFFPSDLTAQFQMGVYSCHDILYQSTNWVNLASKDITVLDRLFIGLESEDGDH